MAVTALRRLHREGDALALLGIIEDDIIGAGDDLECGRFCLERATTLAAVGDPTAGRSFGLARAFFIRAEPGTAPAALAELALQEAIAAWNDGDSSLAGACLDRAQIAATPSTRAGARHLRGQMAASDLAFSAQLEAEHENVRELATFAERDVWLEATTLQTLTRIAIELDERHITKLVRARTDALPWTESTREIEFDVLRNLAWYEVVRGDRAEGRKLMTRAIAAATGERDIARSLVDRARFAEIEGDPRAAERLAEAGEAVAVADWNGASVATLETLLELAHLCAAADPERSRALLARYRDERPYSMSPAHQQPLTVARERFWYGYGAAARGERDVARGHLQHAFDFWCTVGFIPRATIAAVQLYALGARDTTRACLVANADRWPNSLLQARIDGALARDSAANA